MQALRVDGSLPTTNSEADEGVLTQSIYQAMYDGARSAIVEQFETQTKSLLTDSDPAVRRAFLGSVSSLCVFFGSAKASDVVLSHLNTYLNDRDWMLKCAFFETIVGVATYVGAASFEEFILPLMVQALTDPEEFVVERVLRSLSAIAQLGLFQRSRTWELTDIVGRFMIHPNVWIREAAVEFIASVTSFLSSADREGIILPSIGIYLKVKTSDLSEYSLLDALKKPLSRTVFELALSWATKVEKGLFWRPAQQQRTFSFNSSEDGLPTTSGKHLSQKSFARVPKNDEDDKWIWRLRNAGMVSEDEVKLLALREYIWRVAHRKLQEDDMPEASSLNGIMTLTDLKVSPQTVFFDNDQDLYRYFVPGPGVDQPKPQTIMEALQEATMSTDQPGGSNTPRGARDPSNADDVDSGSPASSRPAQSKAQLSPETVAARQDPLQLTKALTKASTRALDLPDHAHALRRKGSAISLIDKTSTGSKALAEISTTPTNAFGQVERAFGRSASTSRASPNIPARDERQPQRTQSKRHNIHSYSGHDPSVLKLLDSLYLDNYPVDLMDFGPLVAPNNRRQPIQRPGGQSGHYWKPEGQLVAMLGEHTAAINRIAVAPDHAFFITGSDDGTVKVWDTSRLEKNISNRSRQTHRHSPGVKVMSICFVEDSHCFVSAGSDGSVQVVKVGIVDGDPPRYTKLQVVREYQLPDDQYAVWIEHYKSDNQSLLMVATNKSRILGIELRNMSVMFEFQSPLHLGSLTCFCLDKKHHWMLVSTTFGVLSLWDLRFRIRVRTWAFPFGYPIHRLMLAPGRGSRRSKFAIAGGTGPGEVTVWDLEKLQWKEAYRTGSAKELKGEYKLIDLEDAPAGSALRRLGSSQELKSGSEGDLCVSAITMGSHYNEDSSEPRYFFLLSAGPDWKVRFWDPSRQDATMVVNGLELDEGKPTYRYSHPAADVTVIQETLHPASKHSGDTPSSTASPNGKSSPSPPRKASGKHGRSSIISLQQQHLLRSHLDNIEDVALLEYPFGMVVSADRSGVIYVFS